MSVNVEKKRTIAFTVVDAFTDRVFKGNPAAVIIMDSASALALPDEQRQNIAREFNLSETAFIVPHGDDKSMFDLRWFTPEVEAALCGHATLASAHVLFHMPGLLSSDNLNKLVRFQTRKSGILTARRVGSAEDALIELELPAGGVLDVSTEHYAKAKDSVAQALGDEVSIKFVGAAQGVPFKGYLVIEVEAPWDLGSKDINPGVFVSPAHHIHDFVYRALINYNQASLGPDFDIIILTAAGNEPSTTFVSRVFVPNCGVPEDPVTGSAHCVLGPYWQTKLKLEDGAVMLARQASKRGGKMEVVWEKEKGTCRLRGSAVVATRGELFLSA